MCKKSDLDECGLDIAKCSFGQILFLSFSLFSLLFFSSFCPFLYHFWLLVYTFIVYTIILSLLSLYHPPTSLIVPSLLFNLSFSPSPSTFTSKALDSSTTHSYVFHRHSLYVSHVEWWVPLRRFSRLLQLNSSQHATDRAPHSLRQAQHSCSSLLQSKRNTQPLPSFMSLQRNAQRP